MVWLPRNAKKCIFFTPFSLFLAKKFFFSKIRLHHFFGTIKSYLDTKSQKKLWGRSSGIYSDGRTDVRTYGRTDGRTDECKSIVPPKFLGRSKNCVRCTSGTSPCDKNTYKRDKHLYEFMFKE